MCILFFLCSTAKELNCLPACIDTVLMKSDTEIMSPCIVCVCNMKKTSSCPFPITTQPPPSPSLSPSLSLPLSLALRHYNSCLLTVGALSHSAETSGRHSVLLVSPSEYSNNSPPKCDWSLELNQKLKQFIQRRFMMMEKSSRTLLTGTHSPNSSSDDWVRNFG